MQLTHHEVDFKVFIMEIYANLTELCNSSSADTDEGLKFAFEMPHLIDK